MTSACSAARQTVPVPRDLFVELQEKGWYLPENGQDVSLAPSLRLAAADSVWTMERLEALGASGLCVDVEEPGAEAHARPGLLG